MLNAGAPGRGQEPEPGALSFLPASPNGTPLKRSYRLRLMRYEAEVVEMTWVAYALCRSTHKRHEGQFKELSQEEAAERRESNEARAQIRAKATVRRKIMAARLHYLVSITYRDRVTDLGLAWKNLTRFVRLVRKKKRDWPYVCVSSTRSGARSTFTWPLGIGKMSDFTVRACGRLWGLDKATLTSNVHERAPPGVRCVWHDTRRSTW